MRDIKNVSVSVIFKESSLYAKILGCFSLPTSLFLRFEKVAGGSRDSTSHQCGVYGVQPAGASKRASSFGYFMLGLV